MIHNWAFQWKMNFNPDRTKEAQELNFSRKTKESPHPRLVFKRQMLLIIIPKAPRHHTRF